MGPLAHKGKNDWDKRVKSTEWDKDLFSSISQVKKVSLKCLFSSCHLPSIPLGSSTFFPFPSTDLFIPSACPWFELKQSFTESTRLQISPLLSWRKRGGQRVFLRQLWAEAWNEELRGTKSSNYKKREGGLKHFSHSSKHLGWLYYI